MAFAYKNFRGDTYYLHSRQTKKGNVTYHFSRELDALMSVEEMPNGYEIYEEPNGKVYVRKETKPLIKPDEIKIINDSMRKYCEINDFKLDIKKNVIYIYTIENSFQKLSNPRAQKNEYKFYETNLRFILVDKDSRTFAVERYCYIGSIDDWIDLDCNADLRELVEKYVQHLGKESFYELI